MPRTNRGSTVPDCVCYVSHRGANERSHGCAIRKPDCLSEWRAHGQSVRIANCRTERDAHCGAYGIPDSCT